MKATIFEINDQICFTFSKLSLTEINNSSCRDAVNELLNFYGRFSTKEAMDVFEKHFTTKVQIVDERGKREENEKKTKNKYYR